MSGFRREATENCTLQCCYAASGGEKLPTLLRNNSEDCRSQSASWYLLLARLSGDQIEYNTFKKLGTNSTDEKFISGLLRSLMETDHFQIREVDGRIIFKNGLQEGSVIGHGHG
jgi:hypothetical protein